jgi:hypothetical protein
MRNGSPHMRIFLPYSPYTYGDSPYAYGDQFVRVSQRSFLESCVHQIFSVQMHTRALKKIITVDNCDDTTGNEVNDDGDGATGDDNNDNFDGRQSRRRRRSQ